MSYDYFFWSEAVNAWDCIPVLLMLLLSNLNYLQQASCLIGSLIIPV